MQKDMIVKVNSVIIPNDMRFHSHTASIGNSYVTTNIWTLMPKAKLSEKLFATIGRETPFKF